MMNNEPDYEAALGLIKHLSTDELRELVNNENKLAELIQDLPQMKNLCNEKELLLTANKSLAEYNLSYDIKLSQGRQDLISKFDKSAELVNEIERMKSLKAESITKHPPDIIQALLQTAAHEKEEETEKLVQSLLDNASQIDEFLPEFVNNRSTAHTRRIKAEKSKDMLNHSNIGYSTVVTTPWTTPYPTQLPNMPLPPYPML